METINSPKKTLNNKDLLKKKKINKKKKLRWKSQYFLLV